jgi:hypothetical protein
MNVIPTAANEVVAAGGIDAMTRPHRPSLFLSRIIVSGSGAWATIVPSDRELFGFCGIRFGKYRGKKLPKQASRFVLSCAGPLFISR